MGSRERDREEGGETGVKGKSLWGLLHAHWTGREPKCSLHQASPLRLQWTGERPRWMPSGLRCCETYTNVDKSATERAKLSVSAWILHTKNVIARLRAAHLKPLLKPEYDFRTVTSTKKSFCINNASKLHPLAHRTNSKAGTAASYQLSALEKCSVEKKKNGAIFRNGVLKLSDPKCLCMQLSPWG